MTPSGVDPRGDLRHAVASLLDASRQPELARLVERGDVEVCREAEHWQIGDRAVVAHRLALVLSPADWTRLSRDTSGLEAVRVAFAAATRSFDTEMMDLHLFVRLSPATRSWGQAYRSAPSWSPEEPEPEAVRAATIELALAYGRAIAADVLRRCRFEVGAVGDAGGLRRWVVRLLPDDWLKVERDSTLASQIESMVRAAATGPTAHVGEVVFGVMATT